MTQKQSPGRHTPGLTTTTATMLRPESPAGEFLELSDERDQWQQLLITAERAAYSAGYADGRADERREADRAWAARPPQIVHDGVTLAAVEARRWELRGEQRTRETFGQPHPADYQGQRQEHAA